ncbi:MAG TPA: PQQ-dependent sugar dehydrogenase [Thermoanaerobaculia bacterium]|nr:PQQ-dependent sugar dehydrogenase [Thermoanaerobaculia bacterium]
MKVWSALVVSSILFSASVTQAALLPGFRVEKVADAPGFVTSIVFNESDSLFFSTTDGGIHRVDSGIATEVARVETAKDGNAALLGIAFINGFEVVTHHIVPDLTAEAFDIVNVETGQARTLARILCNSGTLCESEHHGGNPVVAADGSVYVGIGDFGGGSLAQSMSSPAGKIFRITPDGTATVFALGFRNPFDLVVDEPTGKLVVSDNGPEGGDEIHVIAQGDNAGWPLTFGDQAPLPGTVAPVFTFTETVAPTGLSRVRKVDSIPFDGLLSAAFVTGAIYYFPRPSEPRFMTPVTLVSGDYGPVIDVAQNRKGEIYFATGFAIYQLRAPLRGDVNGDGKVDEGDAVALVLELFDGDSNQTIEVHLGTYPATWGADVNNDGVVDSRDQGALARLRSSRLRAVRRP